MKFQVGDRVKYVPNGKLGKIFSQFMQIQIFVIEFDDGEKLAYVISEELIFVSRGSSWNQESL